MLRRDLRERIKALKTIIPDDIAAYTDAVIDIRDDTVVNLSDSRNESQQWIEDERIVDLAPNAAPIPTDGLGAVPPTAAPVFRTLDASDRELAHLIAAGFADEEIALVLDTSIPAVELAVRSLHSLTGYATRPELIVAWHTG